MQNRQVSWMCRPSREPADAATSCWRCWSLSWSTGPGGIHVQGQVSVSAAGSERIMLSPRAALKHVFTLAVKLIWSRKKAKQFFGGFFCGIRTKSVQRRKQTHICVFTSQVVANETNTRNSLLTVFVGQSWPALEERESQGQIQDPLEE